MRLFHVSEESGIKVFEPRIPLRKDLDQTVGLVWAIDEKRLPNFLTPRNCPRVTWHVRENTTEEDRKRFFSSPGVSHVVILEHRWFPAMLDTVLHLYEFNPEDFTLQDDIAGYYVSGSVQIPVAEYEIKNPLQALIERGVEVRFTDRLWEAAGEVKESTLNWSLCRMGYAQP